MLVLNRSEVTQILAPVLGHYRAAIMASATVEELSSTEVWLSIDEKRFVSETGVRDFVPGIATYRNTEYRIAPSTFRGGYRFFRKVRSDNAGTVISGWFKRILFNVYTIIEPSSEECEQSLQVINGMIMEHKLKC